MLSMLKNPQTKPRLNFLDRTALTHDPSSLTFMSIESLLCHTNEDAEPDCFSSNISGPPAAGCQKVNRENNEIKMKKRAMLTVCLSLCLIKKNEILLLWIYSLYLSKSSPLSRYLQLWSVYQNPSEEWPNISIGTTSKLKIKSDKHPRP